MYWVRLMLVFELIVPRRLGIRFLAGEIEATIANVECVQQTFVLS